MSDGLAPVMSPIPHALAQETSWHQLIDAVNADPHVRTTAHVGDIKSGRTGCTDDRFAAVAADFATYRPEHTLAAYDLAIEQCADHIEPDLVMTGDGILVARHENEIRGTTDVEDRPEFAGREATKVIDGRPIAGWFTGFFTDHPDLGAAAVR